MKKPYFYQRMGSLVDPGFFPVSVRSDLLLYLEKSPLTEEQKTGLIDCVGESWQAIFEGEVQPGKLQRQQIEEVSASARRLLASLRKLGDSAKEAMHSQSALLVHGTAPKVRIREEVRAAVSQTGGSIPSSAWDWVEALEQLATYTGETIAVDRQSKPTQILARSLVAVAAKHLNDVTGAFPPSDRSAWFADFMFHVGEWLEIEIGPRVVVSGIKAAR
ncbi:MAG: hypothetical protein C0453_01790 [Comamonadaceae bacterium]|nr:hypothetical protein [Comamonadaceae bacterium]